MRKNIIITAMLFIAFAVNAQTPSYERLAQAQFPGVIIETIVRTYKETSIIGYASTTAGNYFFQTDTSMQTFMTFELPQDYYVTDFEIFANKSVYMCGYNTNLAPSQEGFLGYFNITNTFNSSSPIYLATGFQATLSSQYYIIDRFNELEVYKKNTQSDKSTSIVVVGNVPTQAQPLCCVLEAQGQDGSPLTGWSYTSGTSPRETETMTQITITDDYIVTGGTCSNYHDGIKMRVFEKHIMPDMFSFTAYGTNGYNDLYYFTTNNVTTSIAFPIKENWQMTHLDGNDIAVASFWQYGNQPNPNDYDGVLLHVYDIPYMLTTPNILPLHSIFDNTQQDMTTGFPRIADLRFNKQKSLLYLLMTTDNPTLGIQFITAVIDYPPTFTPFTYHYVNYPIGGPNVKRDHLDHLNSMQNYISSGSELLSNRLTLYAYPLAPSHNCIIDSTLSYYPTIEFNSKMHTYDLDIYRDKLKYNAYQITLKKRDIQKICW